VGTCVLRGELGGWVTGSADPGRQLLGSAERPDQRRDRRELSVRELGRTGHPGHDRQHDGDRRMELQRDLTAVRADHALRGVAPHQCRHQGEHRVLGVRRHMEDPGVRVVRVHSDDVTETRSRLGHLNGLPDGERRRGE